MEGTVRSADGVEVRYESYGSGAPALVFVHGWSCDRTYWRGQVGAFADRYRVVIVDLAGHGASGQNRQVYSMGSFGADVAAVITRLDLPEVLLIGHSMGGDVVVEAARRLPGRVTGLVWVDVYSTLGEAVMDDDAVAKFIAPFEADFATATRDLVRRMFAAGSPPEVVEWVVADMAAAPPRIALDTMRHAVSNEPAAMAGMREVGLPIVAINPDNGHTDAESLRRFGVEAVVMPGVGHFPMLEDPQVFNRLLQTAVLARLG
jgi:pimeloyl-ACP methyl ester carboxylesterase